MSILTGIGLYAAIAMTLTKPLLCKDLQNLLSNSYENPCRGQKKIPNVKIRDIP
ncbi:hypothetical protein [Sedimentisphaera salicampi]|uniref:Uncharacterized protein n=1 Tax=Sedimentisphaera salicampi TaxID=1941349 RepID=A0A1W6LNU0_9BACT|nr:hypothetical protein [Sedimentisphaera salicampi]ARN57458.1 hypothetical protein STSP1_01867 [Sedimentisphaera salicampi]